MGLLNVSIQYFKLLSNTIFLTMMVCKLQKRAKTKTAATAIPMEVRVEKALEAIYICCYGKDIIEEEDKRLLNVMLSSVFQSVEQREIQRIVAEKARKVADGSDEVNIQEPKPLPKEAVKLQMKDLQFLKQNSEIWIGNVTVIIAVTFGWVYNNRIPDKAAGIFILMLHAASLHKNKDKGLPNFIFLWSTKHLKIHPLSFFELLFVLRIYVTKLTLIWHLSNSYLSYFRLILKVHFLLRSNAWLLFICVLNQ